MGGNAGPVDAGGKTAVILGAGGAARAAVYGLLQRGFRIHLANRTLARAGELSACFGPAVTAHEWPELPDLLKQADLLVNTTALGMHGKPPLEIELAPLKRSAIVHDIVYVPLQTPLLASARLRGHRTVDGLGMLLQQAVAGFMHWFGVTTKVSAELRAMLEQDIAGKR